MDLGEFYASYRNDGWGAAAYDPGMMVAVLLYAYCRGMRSSRRIAQALEEDVGFRVVAANQQPDFRTICRFRAEPEEALERLFVQVLRMCREAGLVKLGVVDASLAANPKFPIIGCLIRYKRLMRCDGLWSASQELERLCLEISDIPAPSMGEAGGSALSGGTTRSRRYECGRQ